MHSTQSVLDTLIKKVSFVAGRLSLIEEGLAKLYKHNMPFTVSAPRKLKDLRKELSSALREARNATTTEQPTSGPTKSNSTSSDTRDLLVVLVSQIAANTRTIVSTQQEIGKALKTGNSGCDGCGRWTENDDSRDRVSSFGAVPHSADCPVEYLGVPLKEIECLRCRRWTKLERENSYDFP